MRDYDQLIALADPEYQAWLDELPQDIVIDNNIVVLYSRKSISERNETNEMELYLQDYLIIGGDSGDMAFVLALKARSPVWRVDEGSLRIEDFEEIAPSFSKWRDSNFTLPQQPKCHLPLHADIYIDHVENLKTMFELKKLLAQNWSANQLKSFLQEQPLLAIKLGPPRAIKGKLKKNPTLTSFVYYKKGESLERICS